MRVRVAPYHRASQSARVLAAELGALRLRAPTRFRPRHNDVIVNWGCPRELPPGGAVINSPEKVRVALSKLESFRKFEAHGVDTVKFTTNRSEANEWAEEGGTVVCRRLTRASSGRGILLYTSGSGGSCPTVPLYTLYVKKRDEYRVFVVNGRVIRITQKRVRRGVEADHQIRHVQTGWVYCQDNVNAPECVSNTGLAAVQALGLDFGAVDIGYNAHYDSAVAYEVNTAFGLEGTTLTEVAREIREQFLAS